MSAGPSSAARKPERRIHYTVWMCGLDAPTRNAAYPAANMPLVGIGTGSI